MALSALPVAKGQLLAGEKREERTPERFSGYQQAAAKPRSERISHLGKVAPNSLAKPYPKPYNRLQTNRTKDKFKNAKIGDVLDAMNGQCMKRTDPNKMTC